MVLIDLGEVRERVEPAPRRAARPPPARWRGLGLLLAAVAVAVAPASLPRPRAFVQAVVPSRTGDYFAVSDDRMYVVSPDARQPGVPDRTIAAYRIPDGAPLWRVPLPITAQIPQIIRVGGALVLQAYDTTGVEMVALDERTGGLLWRRPASFLGVTPARAGPAWLVLGTSAPAGVGGGGAEAQPDVISGVDVRTGGVIWSYRPPPGAQAWPVWRAGSAEVSRMVTALPSGLAEVRDLTTGGLIAAATLRQPVAPMSPEAQDPWLSADEELVLVNRAPDGQTVTAYGLEGLDLRWTARWDTQIPGWYIGSDCGELLCLGGNDGGVRAVDRRTGEVRWRTDWLWAEPAGRLLLASSSRGYSRVQHLVLLDPATGQTRFDLGRWGLVGRPDGGGWVVIRHDLRTSQAWFGLLDSAAPDVRLLGSAGGIAGDCRAGRDSVICRRLDMSIGIWRYR